jgi:MFS family permease
MPSVAANRDFTRLWLGEAVSVFGTRVASVAFPLLVLAMGGSAADAGLASFFRLLPYFVLSLPVGVLVDRIDRRRLMLSADGLGVAAVGSLALTLAIGYEALPSVFLAAFADGAAALAFRTAEVGALPHLVARDRLPDAVALNQSREFAAALAGPPVGGVLFGVGRAVPFFADACSYVVSALAVASIRRPFQRPRAAAVAGTFEQVRAGLAWVWWEPFLRTSVLLVAAANLATNALSLTVILVAKNKGASSALIGAMLALVAAGGLAGAAAAPRLRNLVSRRAIVVGYPWIGVVVLVALTTLPPPLALGALFGAWVFFGPLWDAIVVGYRLTIVPDELQGRVESVSSLIAFGGAALGPLTAGVAFAAFGARTTIGLIAAWTLAVAVTGTLSRSLRFGSAGAQAV